MYVCNFISINPVFGIMIEIPMKLSKHFILKWLSDHLLDIILISIWWVHLGEMNGLSSVYRSGPHVAAHSCQCSDFNETKKTSGWPDEVQGQTSEAYVWGVEWNEGTCTHYSGASVIRTLSVPSPNVWIGEASRYIKCVCCYPKW